MPPAATGSSRCSTARAPSPEPGQFYMLAAARSWGEGGGRPFLPRAISVAETGPATSGVRLDFLVEGVGPGTDRLCELEAGEGVWVTGPLGNAFSAAARGPARRRGGDPRRRRHRHRAAGAACAAASPSRASPSASCSASATASTPAARRALLRRGGELCPEVRLATEDGHAGHRGYVTDLLAAMLDRRRRRVGRRLLLRPAGDAGGGAGAVRRRAASPASWRWSRRWPAASAPASAARFRSPRVATCASASTGRCCVATQVGRGRLDA